MATQKDLERSNRAKAKALELAQATKDKAKKALRNAMEESSQNAAVAAGAAGIGAVVGYKAQEWLTDPANEMKDSMVTTGFGGMPLLTMVGIGLGVYGFVGGLKGRTQAAITGAGAGLAAGSFVKGTGEA